MFHLWFADNNGPDMEFADNAEGFDEQETVGNEVSAVLMDLMPWGLAVLLHAAVILLSIFIAFEAGIALGGKDHDSDKDKYDPNKVALSPGGGGGGGGGGGPQSDDKDRTKKGAANLHEDVNSHKTDVNADKTMDKVRNKTPAQSLITDNVIREVSYTKLAAITSTDKGNSGGRLFARTDSETGEGMGVGTGQGTGEGSGRGGGRGSGIGTGVGSGTGSGFGGGVGVDRWCFIIDASGSLIEGMPFVIDQLKEFIKKDLHPEEEFAIFFFKADHCEQLLVDSGDIRPVTKHMGYKTGSEFNKERAIAALDKLHPEGTSNPKEAIRIAFEQPPGTVYLLSDNITGSGQYELKRDVLLRAFDAANDINTPKYALMPDGTGRHIVAPATIHAIQYLSPDPLLKEGFTKPTLQEVVEENNKRKAIWWMKEVAPKFPNDPKAQKPPPGGLFKYYDASELFGKD